MRQAEDRIASYEAEAEYGSPGVAESGVVTAGAAMGPQDSNWSSTRSSGGLSLDADGMEFAATLSKAETLSEHLTDQLALAISDPADRLIGQHLIGMVNEAGYLTADTASVAVCWAPTSSTWSAC